jgi:CubicO group peptidase (beta-lactamase class C family)
MLNIKYLFTLLFLGSLGIGAHSQTQNPSTDLPTRIRQVEENLGGTIRVEGQGNWTLKERMAYYKIKGLSIAVISNYKMDWAKSYGEADASDHRKVTKETLFQVASISKSLNGVGLLKLAQDGRIDLNTDINNYLTTWKFPYDDHSGGKKITIAQLLSHTAGLSGHGFPGYEPGKPLPTVQQILEGKTPANTEVVHAMFEPGVKMEYSGGGTTITQLIVMNVTHLPYEQFMAANVLKPMGMNSSFYTPPQEKRSLLATGYNGAGDELPGKFRIHPEMAAAGLWTNPSDLSKYIIETQLSLEGKSAKVLSQSFTKTRLTPTLVSNGLGIFTKKIGGDEYFEHGGSNAGFRSFYTGSMKGGNGVVVMVNSDNGDIIQEVVNSVFFVYGWDMDKPIVKKIATLTSGQWKALDGVYQINADSTVRLQITTQNDKLMLKESWSGREVTFEAESELAFFCRDFNFPLKFTKNDKGEVTELLAFERDVWKKVK